MGTVHGVAQLQGGHFAPSAFFENLAGFGRAVINAGVFCRIFTFAEYLDRAGEVDRALFHDHLDAGMIILGDLPELIGGGGAFTHEDFFAFPGLVGIGHREFFGDFHGGHDLFAFGIEQGDFVAFLDTVGFILSHIQAYRDGPEGAVGRQKVFAYAFPVGLGHETRQGAEPADADHDQVAFDAGRNIDFFQAIGLLEFGLALCAFQQAHGQAFSAMGRNQL